MKIYLFLIACILCGSVFAGNIKESAVPAKMKAYLTAHYPDATGTEWDFDDDDNVYEAEFKIKGLEYKLEITPEGVLHASKEDLAVSALPESINAYIRQNYPDYRILGANKKMKGGKVTYDVGIKGKNSYGQTRHHNIYFNEKGEVIKK